MAAGTSNWVWGSLIEGIDINVNSGSFISRDNWSFTRSRYSDEAYASQLGALEPSLSGYNGGVTHTVYGKVIENGVTFSADSAWTKSTTLWIPTGNTKNGYDVYIQRYVENAPDSTKVNALWLIIDSSTSGYRWMCAELTTAQFENNTMANSYQSASQNFLNSSFSASFASPATAEGKVFGTTDLGTAPPYTGTGAGSYGTFTGATTASASDVVAAMICQSDSRTYENSVDWYKQSQTWTYKDDYK